MKKIKILAIAKSPKHNYYAFTKNQEFLKIARKLFQELKITNNTSEFGRPIDKKIGETDFEKDDDITTYVDKRYSFDNEEYFVEIIFGKEKIFLMIHTEENKQQMIAEFLSQFVEV